MSNDFGGRMTLRFSNGTLISLRATVNLNPARVSISSVTNQDGSLDRTGEMKAGRCEITFSDGDQDLDALLQGERFNATLIEDFSGKTHYFTRAFVTGDPVSNRLTGEVTGAALEFESYKRG